MRNLLNPKWLFVINTLPIIVLFILFNGQFSIIKTLLSEGSIELWKAFGLLLGILGIMNFVLAIYLTIKKREVPSWYAVAALLCYIPFIYIYGYNLNKFIPFDIPQWMVSGNIFLYVGTFLMPTLIYSLFVLVNHFTPQNKEHRAWVSFAIAVVVPVGGYVFSQIILPLWKFFDDEYSVHVLLVIIIAATLVFLFFLTRSIYILATKKSAAWRKYELAWKIPIAVAFPLIGLSVNNGQFLNRFAMGSSSGIFGDFNDAWFYILAFVNGIVICLPNLENRIYRLLLFSVRCITFAYTFYFFLVFLPFLPVSVLAIIAVGIGFLMLTPLVLFVIHVFELSGDYSYLKLHFRKRIITIIAVLSFLVMPALLTASYLRDKAVLNETLSYLYSPDYSKDYNIDHESLEATLEVIKGHKDQNRGGFFGNGIPYLSTYFNWLALDNLTLSDSKINTIEKIFFGAASFELRPPDVGDDNVIISSISSNSTYDKSQEAFRTWVDLELTNRTANPTVEYSTQIDLPDGCWISDYYLYVGNRKEFGILAEKKSAMWIYTQILNENRDPGILYYLTGNTVAFRVFPFLGNEVRKTGIEFLHKEPLELLIDGRKVQLGTNDQKIDKVIETRNVIYISAEQKRLLSKEKRKPYFHFLVDISKGNDKQTDMFVDRMEAVIRSNSPLSENAKISFVNTYVRSDAFKNDWKDKIRSQTFEGGFYLDRAIRKTLVDAYIKTTYPVIVVVTDSIQNAVLDKDFADLKFTFPENDLFFDIDEDGKLKPHSLIDKPSMPIDSIEYSFDQVVFPYKSGQTIAYLPNDNKPSIILKNEIFELSDSSIKEKNWTSALEMQGKWMSQVLHPETSDDSWLDMVKFSFMSKVMTPVTSYLVVENEAQKAMLRKKQQQALAGNRSLDLDEDAQRMSEPGLLVLAFALGLALWIRERRIAKRIKS